MVYLLPAIPYASHVVSIDEQESEGNCCDDDDSSHCLFPLLFVSYALIILILSAKVNAYHELIQNYLKVVVSH